MKVEARLTEEQRRERDIREEYLAELFRRVEARRGRDWVEWLDEWAAFMEARPERRETLP